MAKAVIFDVGRVLFEWDLRHLFAKLIADPAELDWFLTTVITPEWHFQHDAGRDLDSMLAERIAEFPDHAANITAYRHRFNETIPGPVPGTHDLVRDLHVGGVPLYIISNFGDEFWEAFRPTQPIFDLFQGIIISGKEKLMKPDPAIFELTLNRFALNASDCLFIDDVAANVAGAESVGIAGHQFIDAPTLREWLIQEGVLTPTRQSAFNSEQVIARVSDSAFGKPLVTNVLRGHVVEAIVALALEPDWTWCSADYASWDFERSDGVRVEVKQSAYQQSWQRNPTKRISPGFDVKAREGHYVGSTFVPKPGRAAHIYILAYHGRQDHSADHRDPEQWEFFVLQADAIPAVARIGLGSVRRLTEPVPFWKLATRVNEVVATLNL